MAPTETHNYIAEKREYLQVPVTEGSGGPPKRFLRSDLSFTSAAKTITKWRKTQNILSSVLVLHYQ